MKGGFHMIARRRSGERGQILVLFTLALISLLAMVGLILDGGDTFAQRRDQQNGADLAAMAGANAYLNSYATHQSVATATSDAIAAARAAATRNGYTDATNGAAVGVSVNLLGSGAQVRVDLSAPHQNTFSRVVGFDTWTVATDATAETGTIDTAVGAAPWTMSVNAFNNDGSPKYTSVNPQDFGETNGDYPTSSLDIAWTDFNGSNNVNTNEVRQIINGSNVVVATFGFDQYLGQHNQGNHTALYGEVNTHLAGKDVPVPIVGPPDPPATECEGPAGHPDGCFKGWAMFHVISASGGSNKDIRGYFLPDGFQRYPLTVGECTAAQQAANQCGKVVANFFGSYTVRLID
jgi:Flp pilus assembly protein TadG